MNLVDKMEEDGALCQFLNDFDAHVRFWNLRMSFSIKKSKMIIWPETRDLLIQLTIFEKLTRKPV